MSDQTSIQKNSFSALIIANGEACNSELLKELLEKTTLVIVLDSAIERVLNLGIKPDVLLGDFDRDFDSEFYKKKYYPLEIVPTPNQYKTDLEKAFDYLIEKGHQRANVIWATGKRADHTITNITNIVAYRNHLNITILDNHSRVFLLPKKFKQWYAANTIISLIPIGKVSKISTKNLFYSLNNEDLTIGYRTGSSNHVTEDGIVTINHEDGDLLLMECWD